MNWLAGVLSLMLMSQSFASIEIVSDTIVIKNDPQFENMLEIKSLVKHDQSATLKETGYILGTTQFSFENGHVSSNWVTMDEKVLEREGVKLEGLHFSKGTAYGILYTSHDLLPRLRVGQHLVVNRYGIAKDSFAGSIYKLVSRQGQDVVAVHFLVHGEELIPGTSCEISVNEIKLVPYQVSLLSLLHIGLEDYVVVKTGPGKYIPKHVTILDQDKVSAVVMMPLETEYPYVARGAILLKPLLSKILNKKDN